MDATIVIPTKNGGELFDRVLTAIDNQKTDYSYEVVCVDSGSSDDTVSYIKKHGCILKEIPKEEFGHGKTRNLGASLGTGEFILFLTQDALPYDEHWLQNFIDGMKLDPEIAGGFGKHYPYPECDIYEAHTLTEFFKGFGLENTIYQLTDREKYDKEETYRHFLVFYSDNNSCMRRSVWNEYPYPDVDFSEDQIWSKQMLELGFKKLYCPTAAVYHSHSYPAKEYRQRFYDEYKSLYRLHGYKLVHGRKQVITGYLSYLRNDLHYLRTVDLPIKEKLHWGKYAVIKDWYRFYSGWQAGRYFSLSEEEKEKLDKKLSQQLRQRKR